MLSKYLKVLFSVTLLVMASGCSKVIDRDALLWNDPIFSKQAKVMTVDSTGAAVVTSVKDANNTDNVVMEPIVPKPVKKAEKKKNVIKYSFSARRERLGVALASFASRNNLTIINDHDVDLNKRITVVFRNLPIEKAMEAILEPQGYYASIEDGIIYVRNMETRIFHVDYPRYIRSGIANTLAGISSGAGSGGQDSGGGNGGQSVSTGSSSGQSGSDNNGGASGYSNSGVNINEADKIDFWGEIEKEIKSMLDEEGKVTINRLSGEIMVHDHHTVIKDVARYLNRVKKSINKQVKVIATIMEVSTSNSDSIGIDWNRVTQKVMMSTSTAMTGGIAGNILSPSLNMTYNNNSNTFKAVLKALQEQGKVKVISKPQLITLNNQPAMIKVGTDRTFFRIQTITNNTTAGSTTTTNDVPQNITLGLVMSITPQISNDGHVIINIAPVITSLEGEVSSRNGSTAPIVNIKQITSMVRVKSGQSIVIGGLIDQSNHGNKRSVPILGDMPFIGGFFSTRERVKTNKNLVIFITPYIVKDNVR